MFKNVLRRLSSAVLGFLLVTGGGSAARASDAIRVITVDDAEALLKKDAAVVVLDIRTPEEFQAGHIKGAVNIDFTEPTFDAELAKLDRNKTYLMHCASGGRSSQAEEQFGSLKFTSVLHLKAGFNGWKKAGKPVVK